MHSQTKQDHTAEEQGQLRRQIFEADEETAEHDTDEKKDGSGDEKKTGDSKTTKSSDTGKDQTAGGTEETTVADDTLYVISKANAYIYNDKLEATTDLIPKWTEIKIKESKTENKAEYAFVKASDDSKEYGWTLKSNLYSLSWNPKDNETGYKKISSSYNDQMQKVDPVENLKKLKLSGSDTFSNVDALFPNSTDVNKLDSGFKTKYEKLKKCFEDNGISTSANAGLRHPLRSTIFNYAISVRDAVNDDIIHEANAVCKKYGIPIDWAHKNDGGTIDLAKSKSQAKLVCASFGIKDKAARGVTDFSGKVSNHNSGKAVDVTLTFSFTDKKKITYNSKDFEVDPAIEKQDEIADIDKNQLTLLGKEASGLNRSVDDDTVHWSEAGN
ncbi:MAG: LysM peptidoglycan-binding protein [Bacteroidetes bacterium]|nr:LysM peptidoglycan-binding protein [Bacteroidota bacterium]